MKPKDLKSPFSFEERRPHLQDGILHVPAFYEGHELYKMPSLQDIFGNDHPVSIEYCSGNGDWILKKALENPEKNWIAVDKLYDRVRKIWAKKENHFLKNLLIVNGEAYTFTKYYLHGPCIGAFYVNFPDPWPKAKHAKHRLIQLKFLSEIAKIAKKGATLTVVTDDETYAMQAIQETTSHPNWISAMKEPFFTYDIEGYGYSYFKELWEMKGKNIHYMMFKLKT